MLGQRSVDDTLRRVRSSAAGRFLILTLIGVGALCGILAVAFERYVEWARGRMIGAALNTSEPLRTILVIATPTVVFTLLAFLITRFAPRAVGANLARVRMAYNEDPALLRPRSVIVTFVATPISLGAGAPLGPEGPIVVVTSGVSAAIGRALRLPRNLLRGMIPVGVAAGIAAVFNTPITGVVFALEEVFGAADRGLLGGVLVGAVAAAVVERSLLGGKPLLAAPFSTWSSVHDLAGFAVVGVVAGVVSGVAIASAHRLKRKWADVMPSPLMRAAGAGLLVGGAGLLTPSILGVGYDSVSFWLHGGGTAESTALAFAVKTIAFVIAISGGVLGGSFAPSLFIGTALGASVGQVMLRWFPAAGIDPKAFAIVGMGAFFAGLLRSPISAVLIVIELTRDYELVVPLMLAVSIGVAISRRISRFSIVEQQMMDEGWSEGHESTDPLARIRVSEAMTKEPIAFTADSPVADALRAVMRTRHRIFPVIDGDGKLTGIVDRDTVANSSAGTMSEIMESPRLVASQDAQVIEVVQKMRVSDVDRCPVVDVSYRLVGFLSPSDLLRVRMAQSPADDDAGFDLFET